MTYDFTVETFAQTKSVPEPAFDLARGKPDALVHHSDQGSQYTSEQFRKLTEDNGVTCSMTRSGNVWGNAAMESFVSSLKGDSNRIAPVSDR